MARIKVELMPWLPAALGQKKAGRLLFEEEIGEGATIGEVLKRMAAREPRFREVVFDETAETIHGYISIVLNSRILGQVTALTAGLSDGDTLRLFPTVDGG